MSYHIKCTNSNKYTSCLSLHFACNTDNYRCIKHRAITKCNSIHNHNKHNIKNKTTYWLID